MFVGRAGGPKLGIIFVGNAPPKRGIIFVGKTGDPNEGIIFVGRAVTKEGIILVGRTGDPNEGMILVITELEHIFFEVVVVDKEVPVVELKEMI